MRRDGIEVWLDGERALFINMQKRLDGLGKEGRKALQTGGMTIVEEAKRNLKNNGSIATGALRASGKVQRVEGDPDSIDAGFFSDKTTGGYAYWVEYGRRAGKMPPPSMIEAWLQKKTATRSGIKNAFRSAAAFARMKPEAYRRQLAYAIARSIAKHGTRPHPFFGPAVEKNRKAVVDAIADAVKKETQRDGK